MTTDSKDVRCAETARHRNRNKPRIVTERALKRFWSKTDRSGGPDACWPFSGSDRFEAVKGWQFEPRRFAWLLEHGEVPPKEKKIYNRCGTSKCVNVAHLWQPTVEERFWRQVEKADGDACWKWLGRLNKGYGGFFPSDREHIRAHRYAWILTHGPIPDALVVRHRCDNPICVRPDHLEIGTHADNLRDMDDRGRRSRGGKHAFAMRIARDRRAKAAKAQTSEGALTLEGERTRGPSLSLADRGSEESAPARVHSRTPYRQCPECKAYCDCPRTAEAKPPLIETVRPEIVRFDLDDRTVTFRFETEGWCREIVASDEPWKNWYPVPRRERASTRAEENERLVEAYDRGRNASIEEAVGRLTAPLAAELAALRDVAEAAENVVAQWRGDISRKPHIGRLRDALAAVPRSANAQTGGST